MERNAVLRLLRTRRQQIAAAEEDLTRLRADAKELVALLDRTTGDEFTKDDEKIVISVYWG
jgi:hypothetical protein